MRQALDNVTGSQGPPWKPITPRLLPPASWCIAAVACPPGEAKPRGHCISGGTPGRRSRRRGSATIDYFLLVSIVLPLAAFILWIGPRAIQSVYDLFTVVVAWPFM